MRIPILPLWFRGLGHLTAECGDNIWPPEYEWHREFAGFFVVIIKLRDVRVLLFMWFGAWPNTYAYLQTGELFLIFSPRLQGFNDPLKDKIFLSINTFVYRLYWVCAPCIGNSFACFGTPDLLLMNVVKYHPGVAVFAGVLRSSFFRLALTWFNGGYLAFFLIRLVFIQ